MWYESHIFHFVSQLGRRGTGLTCSQKLKWGRDVKMAVVGSLHQQYLMEVFVNGGASVGAVAHYKKLYRDI